MNGAALRFSDEAEISVLGACMIDVEAVDLAREIIDERDLYHAQHRLIFRAVCRLRDSGAQPDIVAVGEDLKRRGELGKAGGEEYLIKIAETIPTAANVSHHARRVKQDSRVRALGAAAGWLVEASRNGGPPAEEVLSEAERRIFALSGSIGGDGEIRVSDGLDRVVDSIDHLSEDALSTPWPVINRLLTGGIHPGELVVVAARPTVGKSCLILQCGLHAATRRRTPVLFVSLEMDQASVIRRLLSMGTGLAPARLGGAAQRTADEEEAYQAGLRILRRTEIVIVTGLDSMGQIVSRARRFAAQSGTPPLIVVDYLQLVSGRGDSRAEEVGSVSRALKRLALETGGFVVAAAQLNRQTEIRGSRPRLSDLKDSGAIEADADVVMAMERPELNLVESDITPELRGLCRCRVAKNRNGPTGQIDLHFNPETLLLTEREKRR